MIIIIRRIYRETLIYSICQRNHVGNLLFNFNLDFPKPRRILMDTGYYKYRELQQQELLKQNTYRKTVGSLLYPSENITLYVRNQTNKQKVKNKRVLSTLSTL